MGIAEAQSSTAGAPNSFPLGRSSPTQQEAGRHALWGSTPTRLPWIVLGSPPVLGSRPHLHQADHRQPSQALTGGTVAPREHVCLGGGWRNTMEHSSLH